jgi:hypothetical protein
MMFGSSPSVVERSSQPESKLPDWGHDTSPSILLPEGSATVNIADQDEKRRRATKVTLMVLSESFFFNLNIIQNFH